MGAAVLDQPSYKKNKSKILAAIHRRNIQLSLSFTEGDLRVFGVGTQCYLQEG